MQRLLSTMEVAGASTSLMQKGRRRSPHCYRGPVATSARAAPFLRPRWPGLACPRCVEELELVTTIRAISSQLGAAVRVLAPSIWGFASFAD